MIEFGLGSKYSVCVNRGRRFIRGLDVRADVGGSVADRVEDHLGAMAYLRLCCLGWDWLFRVWCYHVGGRSTWKM